MVLLPIRNMPQLHYAAVRFLKLRKVNKWNKVAVNCHHGYSTGKLVACLFVSDIVVIALYIQRRTYVISVLINEAFFQVFQRKSFYFFEKKCKTFENFPYFNKSFT